MNTVLTFQREELEMNFTHRSDEFRIVLKDGLDNTIIARLNLSEIKMVQDINESTVIITNKENYRLQNSDSAIQTVFDFKNREIFLITNNSEWNVKLEEQEWEKMITYMYEGREGKVLV